MKYDKLALAHAVPAFILMMNFLETMSAKGLLSDQEAVSIWEGTLADLEILKYDQLDENIRRMSSELLRNVLQDLAEQVKARKQDG